MFVFGGGGVMARIYIPRVTTFSSGIITGKEGRDKLHNAGFSNMVSCSSFNFGKKFKYKKKPDTLSKMQCILFHRP